MKQRIYRGMIELTNGKNSSILLKNFATSSFSKKLIRSYSKVYEINIDEVSKNVDSFSNLHDFFTRSLKEGARPIAQGTTIFTSPVDAKIEALGDITDDIIITKVKGF